jgi:hypothetical protein
MDGVTLTGLCFFTASLALSQSRQYMSAMTEARKN